ncbi:MAG: TRAP-type C4-dicarboxylate transport system, periplasmic component [Deltaproteobacteria bacterium]|jgi:TRAP-type C4-dicarboxylate transport system substrate-binding protein|nr:TRAP-type C4-dicarboxylate transport system, periplasmic component [Deltaproteobacteria bacterium]
MKRCLFLGTGFAILAFLACLLPWPAGAAEEKTVTLRYSTMFPAPHRQSQVANEWAKEIERRTNGRVKMTIFPANTLTPPVQTYDSVVKGIADIGLADAAYTRGKFPLTEVVGLPLGYKSATQATKMSNAFFNTFKPKEWDETKVMYFYSHGPGILHSKKAVNKLEDVKGLKIRSQGVAAKIAQALGGAPVGMPMPESYDSLSRGVVDSILCPMEAMKGWKLGEVVGFHTLSYSTAYTSAHFVVMNKSKWNAISPADQKVIEKINEEFIEKEGKAWDEIDKEAIEVIQARGNKIISLSNEESARWANAVKPLLDEFVKEMQGKGLAGDQVLKFCVDYLKANQ